MGFCPFGMVQPTFLCVRVDSLATPTTLAEGLSVSSENRLGNDYKQRKPIARIRGFYPLRIRDYFKHEFSFSPDFVNGNPAIRVFVFVTIRQSEKNLLYLVSRDIFIEAINRHGRFEFHFESSINLSVLLEDSGDLRKSSVSQTSDREIDAGFKNPR